MSKQVLTVSAKALQQLELLGVSKRQLAIYMALLKDGPVTLSTLQQITDVPLTTLFENTEKLLDKGLIRKTRKNKEVWLTAASPTELKNLLHDQQRQHAQKGVELQSLENFLPALTEMLLTETVVSTIKNIDELLEIYREMLASKEVRTFVDLDSYIEVMAPFHDLLDQEAQRNPNRTIYEIVKTEKSREFVQQKQEQFPSYYVKYIPLPASTHKGFDFLIYDNNVVLLELSADRIFGLRIHSPIQFESMRLMHNSFWQLL